MPFFTSLRPISLALLFIAWPGLAAAEAAKVEFVWGSAVALSGTGEQRNLQKGSGIEVGDTVISQNARIQLRFSDGGLVSLAPHSEFRVNAYSYSGNPDGTEHIHMELLKGGLRTISGLIGKAVKTAYELKTAVATMGIRGTEYTVVYAEGVSGTVAAGAIAVCNAGGCLDVAQGQSYQVVNLDTRPVLIDKAAFLPPPPPEQAGKKNGNQIEIAQRDTSRKHPSSPDTGDKTAKPRKDEKTIDADQLIRGERTPKASARDFDAATFTNSSLPKSVQTPKDIGLENYSTDSVMLNKDQSDKIKIK